MGSIFAARRAGKRHAKAAVSSIMIELTALGTGTVVMLGITARAVAGRRAGLIAAVIAAVYPNMWINDGLVMSETLTILLSTMTLFTATYAPLSGGKSDALLMAALQYVDVPGYSAIIMRRTFAELSLEGALMSRAHSWLGHTDATWNGNENRWRRSRLSSRIV